MMNEKHMPTQLVAERLFYCFNFCYIQTVWLTMKNVQTGDRWDKNNYGLTGCYFQTLKTYWPVRENN